MIPITLGPDLFIKMIIGYSDSMKRKRPNNRYLYKNIKK